ncbi:hypothetical protein [Aquitalea magnusonii]|uniref:hypothetical protein n=1 Tax=Aquitalea magnusonii TaxID=332411 RepID=UPI0011AE1BF6|nr:hypothetical protein [Aquitalea magnusonii]
MQKHPGTSQAALLKYYEEVHQELAPLARQLEAMVDHAELLKAKAISADRMAILNKVNALIRTGDLPARAHSERNGMVLAYNAIYEFIADQDKDDVGKTDAAKRQ